MCVCISNPADAHILPRLTRLVLVTALVLPAADAGARTWMDRRARTIRFHPHSHPHDHPVPHTGRGWSSLTTALDSRTPCRRRARPYVSTDGQAVRPGRTNAGSCARTHM
ncbi:hypothetical protein B0H14DRAFT_3056863, partial [Mycena olivaceomarginata]